MFAPILGLNFQFGRGVQFTVPADRQFVLHSQPVAEGLLGAGVQNVTKSFKASSG